MRGIEGKVVVLGSRGVGKTRLVTKYIKNTLHKDIGPTIAASFFTCKVVLDDVKIKLQMLFRVWVNTNSRCFLKNKLGTYEAENRVNLKMKANDKIKGKIWDTAGQERFKAVAPMYYRNANAAILVFDLTQHRTFVDIKAWIQELHRNVQDPMVLTLVGNKLDLLAQRAVTHDEAYLFATSIGATYFETSAETDQGLEQVFLSSALGLVRLADEGKSRSLRQFDSCDSISAYTNNNTAVSHTYAALAAKNGDAAFRLPYVHIGIPVDGDDERKVTGIGRLETPSWSIEHIALGEAQPSGWCW